MRHRAFLKINCLSFLKVILLHFAKVDKNMDICSVAYCTPQSGECHVPMVTLSYEGAHMIPVTYEYLMDYSKKTYELLDQHAQLVARGTPTLRWH